MSENLRKDSEEEPQKPKAYVPENPLINLEGVKPTEIEDEPPAKMTRRHFLRKAAIIGGAVVLGSALGREIFNRGKHEEKTGKVAEDKLKKNNEGGELEALKNPGDLPEDHFLNLPEEKLREIKQLQWQKIKDLDDNDPKKIVYFRRFIHEFKASKTSGAKPDQSNDINFDHYIVDTSRMDSVPSVEPLRVKIQIPKGRKIGFAIGYHHLEKPWGRIFMDMFNKQVEYDPNQIEFILVENKDVPTGDDSPGSNKEIQKAVKGRQITDLIDIHEELSSGNHYMDKIGGYEYKWYDGERKNPNGPECTLDPFVPTWMIEQYYDGRVYPQLQYAVNDQINTATHLIQDLTHKK